MVIVPPEVHVMWREITPNRRRHENRDFVCDACGTRVCDSIRQNRVGRHGEIVSVLFDAPDRDDGD
jgi:hypothetical protein